jgi:hypothetical protein
MGYERRDKDEIERTVTGYLVRDGNVTAPCIARFGFMTDSLAHHRVPLD